MDCATERSSVLAILLQIAVLEADFHSLYLSFCQLVDFVRRVGSTGNERESMGKSNGMI